MVAGVSVPAVPVPVLVVVMMVMAVRVLLLVSGRVAGHHHSLGVLPVHLGAEAPGSGPEVGVRA